MDHLAFKSGSLSLVCSGIGEKNQTTVNFSGAAEKPTKEDLATFKDAFEALSEGTVEEMNLRTVKVCDVWQ